MLLSAFIGLAALFERLRARLVLAVARHSLLRVLLVLFLQQLFDIRLQIGLLHLVQLDLVSHVIRFKLSLPLHRRHEVLFFLCLVRKVIQSARTHVYGTLEA